MAEPFLAEIRMVGFNFAPQGWALCDGQLLPISQNTALFSLLGTTYGGDGKSTFALPDLRGRAPLHQGQGPGLTTRDIGSSLGQEQVTLNAGQLPAHTHALNASADNFSSKSPTGSVNAEGGRYGSPAASPTTMSPSAIASAGGGQAHDNMQPSLTVNFIIALQGIFPSRS